MSKYRQMMLVRRLLFDGCSAERVLAGSSLQSRGGRTPVSACPVRRYAQVATAQTLEKPDMFCYQCEQTKSRKGCVTVGVCGKTAQVAALQDTLIYALQGLGMYANRALAAGIEPSEACGDFIMKAMFSTLTNVNFDQDRFPGYIERAIIYRDGLRARLEAANKQDADLLTGPSAWTPTSYDVDYLEAEGRKVGVLESQSQFGTDLNGVRYMIIYGLKGLAAYAAHAAALGQRDPIVPTFIYQTLDFLSTPSAEGYLDLGTNLALALKLGEVNVRVMEMMDAGHREQLGVPSPNQVDTVPVPGKAILVSGHDMMDLYQILKVTEPAGINVYTHGEMLPAHSYPKLRQFKNLVGQFGGAWQNQKIEFAMFPGPVMVTTNCVIDPLRSYKDKLYTLNETGLHGVKHVDVHNKAQMDGVIEHARALPGFAETKATRSEGKQLTVGFGHEVILSHAATVLNAVEKGDLSRVFVIGGCDGSEHKRNYFGTLARSLPKDTLILTLGCAKYRLLNEDYGTLGDTGIPRLLDMGQCNDAYGAVVVAKALASALNIDINSLPLSISLSWFEQKAVAVLLSLLSLGIKNIRLGPVMPAFLTPNVRKALEEKFNLMPVDIRHPLDDMKTMSKGK